MRVICFSHPERDCDGERDGAVVLWSDDVTLPPPHVHPPPSPLRTPPLGRYYDNITMAAEEDELVSRYAHDLVTRVLKTSMKQLEGSVQWPSSATFTAAVGRDTIEQLVSVTSLSGRRALSLYKPTRLLSCYTELAIRQKLAILLRLFRHERRVTLLSVTLEPSYSQESRASGCCCCVHLHLDDRRGEFFVNSLGDIIIISSFVLSSDKSSDCFLYSRGSNSCTPVSLYICTALTIMFLPPPHTHTRFTFQMLDHPNRLRRCG